MFIWCILGLGLLYVLAYGMREGKKLFPSGAKEGLRPFGRWCLDVKRRLLRKQKTNLLDGALPFRKEEEEKKMEGVCIAAWGLLMTGCLVCFLLSAFGEGGTKVTRLLRPEFGKESKVSLWVSDGSTEEEVTVRVPGQEPEEEELEEIFEGQFAALCEEITGDGEDLSHVRTDLKLIHEDEYGISYHYKSSDILMLSDRGVILATEEELQEGIDLTMEVRMAYKEFERTYRM